MANKSLGKWAELDEGQRNYLLKLPPKQRAKVLKDFIKKLEDQQKIKRKEIPW